MVCVLLFFNCFVSEGNVDLLVGVVRMLLILRLVEFILVLDVVVKLEDVFKALRNALYCCTIFVN